MKKLYCIPCPDRIADFVSFAGEYDAGFEYNDFFLPDVLDSPDRIQDLTDLYRAQPRDRSEDTLHGAFLDMCVNSSDSRIFAATDLRIHQSMDIASSLGVKAVIFHTNHIPNFRLKSYRREWLDRNETYWRRLLSAYPGLSVYMENMFDEEPELLALLAARMTAEPRFRVCFDFAHACISGTSPHIWCQALAPFTGHMHINDNDGLEDTHRPVGSGSLPWEAYRSFIDSLPEEKRPSVLIEVRTYEDLMASVAYMKEKGLFPLR